jgi:bifunctional DNA-binding transcriptional regulator/antitoxin component of YhaV-PrlF toxin-antitoxin module
MLRNMLRNKVKTCGEFFEGLVSNGMKKYIRKVTRVGKRSLSVVIPAEIVDELKIRERQKVVVTRRGKKITISDWKPAKRG